MALAINTWHSHLLLWPPFLLLEKAPKWNAPDFQEECASPLFGTLNQHVQIKKFLDPKSSSRLNNPQALCFYNKNCLWHHISEKRKSRKFNFLLRIRLNQNKLSIFLKFCTNIIWLWSQHSKVTYRLGHQRCPRGKAQRIAIACRWRRSFRSSTSCRMCLTQSVKQRYIFFICVPVSKIVSIRSGSCCLSYNPYK